MKNINYIGNFLGFDLTYEELKRRRFPRVRRIRKSFDLTYEELKLGRQNKAVIPKDEF